MPNKHITQFDIIPIKGKNGSNPSLVKELTDDGTGVTLLVQKVADLFEQDRSQLPEVKDVVGFEDRFMVSEHGDLISKKTNKVLSQTPDENGYLTHATKIGGREGKNVLLRMHRVVGEAFIPNPDNKPYINHDDGVKTNNHKPNLEWSTQQENIQHAYDTGLAKAVTGLKHGRVRMTAESLSVVRSLKGEESCRAVGERFGIHHTTVLDIWKGKSFKDD